MRPSIVATALLAAACGVSNDAPTAPSVRTTQQAALPRVQLVVLDSLALPLAGTAADRDRGTYSFAIRGPVPTINVGDYVVVKERKLFLGRVGSASLSATLDLVLLPAEWNEVLKPFRLHIPNSQGAGRQTTAYGEVRWGPWHSADPSKRESQKLTHPFDTPSLFGIDPESFGLTNLDLCGGSSNIQVCNVSARLVSGHFSLTGAVDASADFDFDPGNPLTLEGPSLGFGGSVVFTQQLDASLDFELSGTGKLKIDVPVGPGFQREFSVGPFDGTVTLGLILGAEANVDGTVGFTTTVGDAIKVGGELSSSDGFSGVFEASGTFGAGARVEQVDKTSLKIQLGPQASMEIDLKVGSFGLSMGANGFVEGVIEGPVPDDNWYAHVDVGTEASVAASASLDLVVIDLSIEGKRTFSGPGLNLAEMWGTADLRVTETTTGLDVFPGQVYTASVARQVPAAADKVAPAWSSVLASNLGVNASADFAGGSLCYQLYLGALAAVAPVGPQDCDLVATEHVVGLFGIAWNCESVVVLPAAITLRPRHPFNTSRLNTLELEVACRSVFDVVNEWIATSPASANAGVANALRSQLRSAKALRDGGNPQAAANVLDAFASLVRAQTGRQISPAVAAQLQRYVVLIKKCYLERVPSCSTV